MQRRIYVLDAKLFVVSVFMILVVGRAIGLIVPQDYYFTFQSLFSDRSGQNIVLSLLGKMLAPALCGAVIGAGLHSSALRSAAQRSGSHGLVRRATQIWSPTVLASGFFAAFLSAWPTIAYWDLVSNPTFASLKAIFFLMFALYMVAFGYVTLLGMLGAVYVREQVAGVPEARRIVSLNVLGRVGALWIINSGVASSVLKYISQ
jgi:hypothetical protein